MADDRHYVPGDNYLLDDNTGFKIRASKARVQWNSIVTSGTHFNPRHAQDLVQGVQDDQTVQISRARQVNVFTVLATFVIAPAARGALSMTVESALQMEVGDVCQVPLDFSGSIFQFTISAISGNVLSWAAPGLPGTVGAGGGDPTENQVLDLTATQRGGLFSDGSYTV